VRITGEKGDRSICAKHPPGRSGKLDCPLFPSNRARSLRSGGCIVKKSLGAKTILYPRGFWSSDLRPTTGKPNV